MDDHAVLEQIERSRAKGSKGIGLTIAILAVFSVIVNILMSNNNTDKVVNETKTADWWAYTHSSDSNARLYEVAAKVADLIPDKGARLSVDLRRERDHQEKESVDARRMAVELEGESAALSRQSDYYSAAELCLQFSVVLCSIALLTEQRWFWKSSFASAALGLSLAIVGILLY
jgi:Domain of unknown function (DUF4337)